MKFSFWAKILVGLWVVFASQSAYSATNDTVRIPEVSPALWQKFTATVGDKAKSAALIDQARIRSLFCSSCHGPDGNSLRPNIPKLAGQNPSYILEQLVKFSDGRRNHYVMVPLAKEFSDEEKIAFSLLFSGYKLVPAGGDAEMARMGKSIFESKCIACHGSNGRGDKGYARLAGQQPNYVAKVLTHFRDNTPERSSDLMEGVAAGLTDHQIKALSEYVGRMK